MVECIALTNMEAATRLVRILMEPTVELSPHRPFGYYLFCSSKGALFMESYEAEVALPILYYSLARAQDEASISDHIKYGSQNDNLLQIFQEFVCRLTEMEQKYEHYVSQCFQNNGLFTKELRDAFYTLSFTLEPVLEEDFIQKSTFFFLMFIFCMNVLTRKLWKMVGPSTLI